MSVPFTDVTTIENLNSKVLADEIERAYIERTTHEPAGDVDTSDFVVNDTDMWRRWQDIAMLSFINHVHISDVIDKTVEEMQYQTIAEVFAQTALHSRNFRAYKYHPNTSATPQYRLAEEGDIVGSWLWEDLQAVYSVLTTTAETISITDFLTCRTLRNIGMEFTPTEALAQVADLYNSGEKSCLLGLGRGTNSCSVKPNPIIGLQQTETQRMELSFYYNNNSDFTVDADLYMKPSRVGLELQFFGDTIYVEGEFNKIGNVGNGGIHNFIKIGDTESAAPDGFPDGAGYFVSQNYSSDKTNGFALVSPNFTNI